MTYEHEGLMVDVKPTNLHGSDRVAKTTVITAGLIVKRDGNGNLVLAEDGDEGVMGPANQTVDNTVPVVPTQKAFAYTVFGWVRVVASGAISPGENIACDDGGKVKALGVGTFNLKIGRAITEAVNDGDVIEAFVWVG